MFLLPCVVELSIDGAKAGGHARDNLVEVTRRIEEELASGEKPKKLSKFLVIYIYSYLQTHSSLGILPQAGECTRRPTGTPLICH